MGRVPIHLLVAIGGNAREWEEALVPVAERPRLPLPYAFGAALIQRGGAVSCVDSAYSGADTRASPPFRNRYSGQELTRAMNATDAAALWGAEGVRAVARQLCLDAPRRRVVLCTYVWGTPRAAHWRARRLSLATRVASRFARAVIAMTREHEREAAALLGTGVPVVRLVVGVDTTYYQQPVDESDIPEGHRSTMERVFKDPYVIMPGDELRLNSDAVDIAARLGVRLLRVSQYGNKSGTDALKNEVVARGLGDRVLVLERIPYRFLRVLLRKAAAYVACVDSSWQPAGWTVACEALASGLPVVAYEGLVTRELQALGADHAWFKVAPLRDRRAFADHLHRILSRGAGPEQREGPEAFAGSTLNLELTGERFASSLEAALGRSATP